MEDLDLRGGAKGEAKGAACRSLARVFDEAEIGLRRMRRGGYMRRNYATGLSNRAAGKGCCGERRYSSG